MTRGEGEVSLHPVHLVKVVMLFAAQAERHRNWPGAANLKEIFL